jgi:hypothetical protein
MKLRRTTGLVAGLLTLGLLAGPAVAAGPANVDVRVEGTSQTLVPRTTVTTFAGSFGKGGNPANCSGTSAAGALERATAGDWTATYFAQYSTYLVSSIKGEKHEYPDDKSWAFWINYKHAELGACDVQVQQGDDVLFIPECSGCATPEGPLELRVPQAVQPGDTDVTVRESAVVRDPNTFVTTVSERPSSGATVIAGGRQYTTNAAGVARLSLPAGPVSIQATKPGFVRSATETRCATTGADGACGTTTPPPPACATNGADGRCGTIDRTAPTVRLHKIHHRWYYNRRRAPRTLHGAVSTDPSGIRDVRVRLKRVQGKRCASYSASRERFVGRACKRNPSWFSVGDRESWSYLLPARLRRGKYTLDVRAIDKAGNASSLARGISRVVFRVL